WSRVAGTPSPDPSRPIASLAVQERAAAVASPADPEWHAAGARALAASQQPDGSWNEGNDPVAATAQALIFLARGTAALQSGAKRGGTGRLEMKSIGGCSNLMFVLDASGNMPQEMGDKERFDVAKSAISKLAEKMPEGSIAGLRVFGNRRLAIEPGADVEMAVVLLIDGAEMERKADPVPATGDLAASRRGLKVHVVGFNTDDDDLQARMQRMADAGGGKYIKA